MTKCPTCGGGEMVPMVHTAYQTKIPGKGTVVVKNAKYDECSSCGERLYDSKELKRWEDEGEPFWVDDMGTLHKEQRKEIVVDEDIKIPLKNVGVLKIYIYCDDGRWYAQCLDFGVLGDGDTPEEAVECFGSVVSAHISIMREKGTLEKYLYHPAPHEMYDLSDYALPWSRFKGKKDAE